METKHMWSHKKIKILAIVLGTIAAALLIFWAGVAVGYHIAGFSYRFGDNYYRIFEDHRPNDADAMNTTLPGGHGASGIVASIALPQIVVSEQNKSEKIILVTDKTIIRSGENTITSSDIHDGDFIVVVGSPDTNSHIDAEFIRVLPPPTNTATSTVQNN